jgi:hypothetical protein
MKTITIKLTLNGNYVACILPIPGQQSSSDSILIFDKVFNHIETIKTHPLFSWVNNCEVVCTIGGCKYEPDEISQLIKLSVINNVSGYTTAHTLKSKHPVSLLAPIKILHL